MATSKEKWESVKVLFDAALELESSRRSAFLRDNCSDSETRAEVERLLNEHEQAGTFLSTPVVDNLSFEEDAGPQPTRLPGGQVLAGRFKIVRFIACGGMGEVYEAEDLELREQVAVKVIRPEILRQSGAVARFKREVHLARKVTHPNVCRIFDLFRHSSESSSEETVFVSMELLYGRTLSTRLKKEGRMGMAEALPLVRQMASALGAAHAVGIVHRDFKPGNVVLVPGDMDPAGARAVITDFGLALQSSGPADGPSLTTGTALLGTPAYMAPEQIEGRPPTPASDLYALGLVIYEMVTGVRPFQGDTALSAAMKRLSEAPPAPRKFEPGLSRVWESVILRCLERDPSQRFPSAEEVAAALVGDEPTVFRIGLQKIRKRRKIAALAAVLLVAVLVLGGLYYRSHRQSNRLTEKDTIVLADFSNGTGDPIFDDTLKTALNISLRQSPFLNVLSDGTVVKTLQQMTRPASTKLTPEVTRELCLRAGSKAYLTGSIGNLGSEYVLGLKAINCRSGDTLAQEQVTAASKERVLDALGAAASKLRAELGESLASVQKFDVPLLQATTSSLEALKAYSVGRTMTDKASLSYFQRAIDLDHNFAMAYVVMGNAYLNLGKVELGNEYFTKAFQVQDHASEREKLSISAAYYLYVTGELDKAAQTYQEEIQTYPRYGPYIQLGIVYAKEGQYDKAAEITRQAMRLAPQYLAAPVNLAHYTLALQHFDEARQIIHETQARKIDHASLHNPLYALAFILADSAAMTEQQHWFAGRPEYESWGRAFASDTEGYAGRLGRARELNKQAVESAVRVDDKENGAIYRAVAAQRQAAYGNSTGARQSAAGALQLAPTSQVVKVEAALAFAMAGDMVRAERFAQDLGKRFPMDTQMQSLWLPAIRAQLALDRKSPTSALNTLEASSAIELGETEFTHNVSCLYAPYVRGEAYLAAGQGSAAAAEFQKIIDHSGIVWNCWTGALAHLGVARANALQSRNMQGADADAARVRALAAYKDFLALWKDADPEIPIFKQAKAECANLQ